MIGKEKYRVLYMRNISGIMTRVGRKNIKASTQTVNFRKKTFKIDFTNPYYRSRKRILFAIDIDTNKQISSKEPVKDPISPELMHQLFIKESVGQMVQAVDKENYSMNTIILVILGSFLGLTSGFIICLVAYGLI